MEELRRSVEELEGALEQTSMQNGEVEERLREAEGILEETSLAMEDLRLKLDEERRTVGGTWQKFLLV